MLPNAKNKERERYYLLAGMGGRAAKRKHAVMLRWAIITGLAVSLALAAIMIFSYTHLR